MVVVEFNYYTSVTCCWQVMVVVEFNYLLHLCDLLLQVVIVVEFNCYTCCCR